MKVLICFESSGIVREAFRKLGHASFSCVLRGEEVASPFHFKCDFREALKLNDWDLVGFHPPCTFLTSAGLHWNWRGRGHLRTEAALRMVRTCMRRTGPWYLENPVGCISTRIRPFDQKIQPYEFGEDASKGTCLWLNKLPPLVPTGRVSGRRVTINGKTYERWANQTDSGQNKLPPSANRWKLRSRTYPGIAAAMAAQWTQFLSQ